VKKKTYNPIKIGHILCIENKNLKDLMNTFLSWYWIYKDFRSILTKKMVNLFMTCKIQVFKNLLDLVLYIVIFLLFRYKEWKVSFNFSKTWVVDVRVSIIINITIIIFDNVKSWNWKLNNYDDGWKWMFIDEFHLWTTNQSYMNYPCEVSYILWIIHIY
jgi:hypothetical protein